MSRLPDLTNSQMNYEGIYFYVKEFKEESNGGNFVIAPSIKSI